MLLLCWIFDANGRNIDGAVTVQIDMIHDYFCAWVWYAADFGGSLIDNAVS